MDYIGSKIKLNKWIFSHITKSKAPDKDTIFLDGCSGAGAVSRHAAGLGYHVISNDIMEFSKVVISGSIGLTEKQLVVAREWISVINTLGGIDGFFYNKYTTESDRLYFTIENARIIDHIRKVIDLQTDEKVRDYLLYCSIEALSKVSNTAGVHGAFLKQIKPRALQRIVVMEEKTYHGIIDSYSADILKLLNDKRSRRKFQEDILYLDPPYNNRQYGPNYHLYETFIKNDNPSLTGKTGLRKNWQDECGSEFCSSKKCLDFLVKIVESTTAKSIFMSYSTDGILTVEDIQKKYPDVIIYEMEQRRYKADKADARTYSDTVLKEYLFEIHK